MGGEEVGVLDEKRNPETMGPDFGRMKGMV